MEYYIIPLFTISVGLLPISIFSLMIYSLFGTIPGLYYLIIFLVFSAPLHIYLIRLTGITEHLLKLFERSFNELSFKLKKTNPNIFLFLSIGPLFPYIAILLFVSALNKNIFISSAYLLVSTVPGILLVFLITHGLVSENLGWPVRVGLISSGFILFLLTRKSNDE
jgi:hypothetical protein